MAYIPPIAPSARRFPSPVVRPSGEAGRAGGQALLTISHMPRYGKVFIDGREWMGGGYWSPDDSATWIVPNPPPGRVLRVEDAEHNARSREWPELIDFARLDTGELDWNSLTPIDEAPVGTLRVFGAPHAQLRINGGTLLLQGTPSGTAMLYELPEGDNSITIVAPDNFVYPVQTVTIVRGQTTQLPLVRPAAPAPQPTVNQYVGSMPIVLPPTATTRPATGQLTVTGEPGWIVALAMPGSTVLLPPGQMRIPPEGALSAPVPVGSYDLGVQNAYGARGHRIAVTDRGFAIDTRTFAATAPAATGGGTGAGTGTGAGGGGTAPATSDVTVVGPAAWLVTVLRAGADAPTARLPILANGRVVFPLVAGAYKFTVDDGAGHTEARTITVPVAAPIDVSTWITVGSRQNVETGANKPPPADNLPVREVDRFCGPVLNRPAWAPASMCPGDEVAGPDGRYRALAAANGVQLVKLKADGTIDAVVADTGMSGGQKVLLGATALALAVGGYFYWRSSQGKADKGGKVENPGKCSCQH